MIYFNKIIFMIFISFLSFCSRNNEEKSSYSEGYRAGRIEKFSVKGLITKSYEGSMLMGKDSVPYSVTTGSGDNKTTVWINPWDFSVLDSSIADQVSSSNGYVWVKYSQKFLNNPLKQNTGYDILEIHPLDQSGNEPISCQIEGHANYSKGFRKGRVVKLSYKGIVKKSAEAILQIGEGGGLFMDMTIHSELWDCALKVLKTQKYVKIIYDQKFIVNPLTQDSTYTIIGFVEEN